MDNGAWRKWTLNNRKGILSCTASIARLTFVCVGTHFAKCIAWNPWKDKFFFWTSHHCNSCRRIIGKRIENDLSEYKIHLRSYTARLFLFINLFHALCIISFISKVTTKLGESALSTLSALKCNLHFALKSQISILRVHFLFEMHHRFVKEKISATVLTRRKNDRCL